MQCVFQPSKETNNSITQLWAILLSGLVERKHIYIFIFISKFQLKYISLKAFFFSCKTQVCCKTFYVNEIKARILSLALSKVHIFCYGNVCKLEQNILIR